MLLFGGGGDGGVGGGVGGGLTTKKRKCRNEISNRKIDKQKKLNFFLKIVEEHVHVIFTYVCMFKVNLIGTEKFETNVIKCMVNIPLSHSLNGKSGVVMTSNLERHVDATDLFCCC